MIPLLIRNIGAIAASRRRSGGGGGCTTVRESVTSGTNANAVELRYTELTAAFRFVATVSHALCALELYTSIGGSGTSDLIYGEIYADDGNSPNFLPTGAALSTSTGVALSALTNGGYHKFGGMNVTIVSGTAYWAALRKATNDNTNFARLHMQSTAGVRVATNTGSWAYYADRLVNFKTYS